MSIPTTTEKPVVRRAEPSGSLLQEADLPPGQHFIDGAFRPGRSGTSIDVIMNEPFIAAVKSGLAAVGFSVGVPRAPVAELDPDAAARIAKLATAVGDPILAS